MISATLDSSVYVRALHLGGPGALLIGHARADEDKDLLRVGQFGNTRIVNIREFVKVALTQEKKHL